MPQRRSLAAQAPLHGSNIQRSGIWEKVQGGPYTFQKVEGTEIRNLAHFEYCNRGIQTGNRLTIEQVPISSD